jgi:predicted nucleic acid-binding Zn ribbon protein
MTTWRDAGPPGGPDPVRVERALDRVSRRLGGPPVSVAARIFSHWEELVGPEVAAHARPRSLHRGVLVLVVDHSAWAAQLRFLESDLLARVRSSPGGTAVTEVRIRVSPDGRQTTTLRGSGHPPLVE